MNTDRYNVVNVEQGPYNTVTVSRKLPSFPYIIMAEVLLNGMVYIAWCAFTCVRQFRPQ